MVFFTDCHVSEKKGIVIILISNVEIFVDEHELYILKHKCFFVGSESVDT